MALLTRRSLVVGALAASAATLGPFSSAAASGGAMTVWKDASCGCCGGWIEHMRTAGYAVAAVDTANMAAIKKSFGVPERLASCHTARIDGYVIEGHVPAAAVRRLLAERPIALGLAAPGMPMGSPGMETPALPADRYEVILFGPGVERPYMRFEGARAL